MKQKNIKYRIKYWRWVNDYFGEWVITGMMAMETADKVAESLRHLHEQVTIYEDEAP